MVLDKNQLEQTKPRKMKHGNIVLLSYLPLAASLASVKETWGLLAIWILAVYLLWNSIGVDEIKVPSPLIRKKKKTTTSNEVETYYMMALAYVPLVISIAGYSLQ